MHLSLTVIDEDESEIDSTFQHLEKEIELSLGDSLFGTDDDTMESVVGKLLQSQGKILATAESCSGGLIGHKITTVPGSSNYFAGGVIAYSNDLKEKLLGVRSFSAARTWRCQLCGWPGQWLTVSVQNSG